jgi:nucleoside phosphorylase
MSTPLTPPSILVVAATDRELAGAVGVATLRCGVGPVEAAAATAAAIATRRPAVVLHVGIGGARRASGIALLSVVIGSETCYCDLSPSNDWAPRTLVTPATLVEAAVRALPRASVRAIGTSARVGGTSECDVEAMEGFAVLRAAQMAGVPAIEIRVVSNEIEEADRTRWRFDEAFQAVADATPRLIAEITACVS